MPLLCRVAEHMFWLNRYVERAVATIRVVDVTAHLELDSGDADEQEFDFWTPLLGPALEGIHLQDAPLPLPQDVRYYLAFDPDNPSSLVSDPFQLAVRPPPPLDVIHLADCLDPSPLVPRVPVVEEMAAPFRAPSRGVGASHAWVEAFTPTHGWRGFDPTNNLVANEYYVKIAVGRDYSDVPPTRGTYHGGPGENLSVAVTARAID